MLGLKLPTDPRWVNIAEKNIQEILTDHAYCEQKAASTAISLIITYPEHTGLVKKMTELAMEEMSHFKMVHEKLIERGMKLGRERKDEYVNKIMNFFAKTSDRNQRLINRLLVAALIEARSCERFKLLSENIKDNDLAKFYNKLMVSEASHYIMFLQLARRFGEKKEVNKLWSSLLNFEAIVISNLGIKERIHG